MEKNNSKVIAVVALVVAVVALSVGFATYSATLTITNTTATINPANTFSENVKYKASTMSCTPSTNASVVSAGTVSDTVWNGVQVTLTAPGDSVTCQATVQNSSAFVAYLRNITTSSTISCAAGTGTGAASTTNVAAVCPGMELTITAGGSTATATSTAAASQAVTGTTGNTIAAISGTTPGEATVSFTITYKNDAQAADGSIVVTLPQMNLIYETA